MGLPILNDVKMSVFLHDPNLLSIIIFNSHKKGKSNPLGIDKNKSIWHR